MRAKTYKYLIQWKPKSKSKSNQVRRAQHLGASGVIIADNTCLYSDEATQICSKPGDIPCEQVEPIVADDGPGADIAFPR
ncbi:unnamed protein product [Laminaria digitata]